MLRVGNRSLVRVLGGCGAARAICHEKQPTKVNKDKFSRFARWQMDMADQASSGKINVFSVHRFRGPKEMDERTPITQHVCQRALDGVQTGLRREKI